MKYILEYKNGKWLCSCTDLFRLLKKKPNTIIIDAIKAFHNRYYPDEKADSNDYPWIQHVDAKGKIDGLRDKVNKHELTWHWRLLLRCLRDLELNKKDGHPIVLCVSQVRQWQLVSCFRMKWPTRSAGDLARQIRTAPKSLLRPPTFGKSHRITRWEVYAAFYEHNIESQIESAVEKAKGDAFRLAHVLGRHDSYFKVYNVRQSKGRYEFEVEHVIDLEPEHAPLLLEGQEADDVCRPYGLAYVPLFKESSKKKLPQPEELLFSSDNYCGAFEQISDVLNDPSARSILLIAPPGSGKEDLSSILHNCRRNRGQKVVISLGGLDEETAAFQLFHLEGKGLKTRLKKKTDGWQPKSDFMPKLDDGALFKALGGTLVIDELDKVDARVLSMLLRFLESDEVTVPGTSIVLKIPPGLRPVYVFVGSKTRKEFLQMPPIDFWSRITHIVEMQHPLALRETAERLRTAEDYLRFFWLRQVNKFFREENLLKKSGPLYEPLREKFAAWWRLFTSRPVGDFIAREIAEVLCGPGQPLPSVRTLRGTVARCFNLLFHALLYHKQGDAPLEIWRASLLAEASDKLHHLLELVVKGKLTGDKLSLQDVGALSEIRGFIRASASIQV